MIALITRQRIQRGIVWFDHSNVGQCSIFLPVVKPITDDPFVANSEANVINRDVNFGTFCFVEQRAGSY
jgi:hypothetical protein